MPRHIDRITVPYLRNHSYFTYAMSLLQRVRSLYLSASPDLRRRLIIITTFLLAFNIAIWATALSVATKFPLLIGLVTLAYGFGLRHAGDADHIAAIDNTTRKLMRDGKRPVAVGLFFSIGHSTVVVLLSALVAFSASYAAQHLESFKATGSIIGTLVSASFLLALGLINLSALIGTYKLFRSVKNGRQTLSHEELDAHLDNQGVLARILRPLLKVVTSSWNMVYIGFLFGLGFDTASEVGLLSLSAASGSTGLPIWTIMLLPLAFTAGMTLIDSFNGILMLGAYGWAYLKPIRKLYYNMTITSISVITAIVIGGIELLQLLIDKFNLSGSAFTFIDGLDLGNLGYFIVGLFLITWLVSMGVYRFKRYDLLDA